jgi:hypothetical protein
MQTDRLLRADQASLLLDGGPSVSSFLLSPEFNQDDEALSKGRIKITAVQFTGLRTNVVAFS